ncbi:transposase [Pseudomonas sp. GCM10022186]|uniref:REP-associated tyrosine transposase n=1 Tax=Pseudomonas sp. GCM10022186 TaxID=3252650 RepID=UPI00361EA768
MSNYRRAHAPGGTWFFTVNLHNRRDDLLIREIELLRRVVRKTMLNHPFRIDAWVVLPEHMHCLWTLPPDDGDFALRWKSIKLGFSRRIPPDERRTTTQRKRGERGIWQRRYWEHLIRDQTDYQRHFDYIHFNPVKHGHVRQVRDWPYSSFHLAVREGIYPEDWAGSGAPDERGRWGE